jgi:hypothetical protein
MRRIFFEATMNKTRIILLILSLFIGHAYAGAVKTLDIRVIGEGRSYQEALNNALLEAISQVNGKSIESSKISLSIEASETTNESEEYYSSDAYSSLVKERTKGAVSGYQIIQSNEDAGVWQIEVTAQVAKYQASKSSQRKRIVIVPATASQESYQILNNSIKSTEASQKINQSISDVLVGTRKFSLLDRNNDEMLRKELSVAASDASPTAEAARLGQKLVTDFVLVGKLEGLGYSTSSKKMRTSDRILTTGSGAATYSYNLIEVATSQVFFSDTVSVRLTHEDINRANRENSKAITNAIISKMASKIVKTLTSQIYPLSIISKNGNEVILSEGGKSLKVGDSYKVYKRGAKIYDPYTKEFSGFEEYLCCTLKITRVAPKQSYAELLTNSGKLPNVVPPRKFVLRGKIAKKSPKPIQVKPIKEKDNDW